MATCVRRAWLVMGSSSVDLENTAAGWFCTSLDLGYPVVRDVLTNRPDQDGADDRTKYMGARTITVALTAVTGAGARIDDVADSFNPYMIPSARPVLHYILDRPGYPERTCVVRAANYDWPIAGPDQRDIALQWVAADPTMYDPTVNTVIAWAGSSGGAGRIYNWTPNRVYPTSGSGQTSGLIMVAGDFPVRPLLQIYGPITGPQVSFIGAGMGSTQLRTMSNYTINAGHFLQIDTRTKEVFLDGDRTQPAGSAMDWANSTWPVLVPIGNNYWSMTLFGTSTTNASQCWAIWQNGYVI